MVIVKIVSLTVITFGNVIDGVCDVWLDDKCNNGDGDGDGRVSVGVKKEREAAPSETCEPLLL